MDSPEEKKKIRVTHKAHFFTNHFFLSGDKEAKQNIQHIICKIQSLKPRKMIKIRADQQNHISLHIVSFYSYNLLMNQQMRL